MTLWMHFYDAPELSLLAGEITWFKRRQKYPMDSLSAWQCLVLLLAGFSCASTSGLIPGPVRLERISPTDFGRLKRSEFVSGSGWMDLGSRSHFRLSSIHEERIDGAMVDISRCVRCPGDGGYCPVSQEFHPQLNMINNMKVQIPEELMAALSNETVAYVATVPATQIPFMVIPGFSAVLTFTPEMALYTAELEFCRPHGKWSWPWAEDYHCDAIQIAQMTPIVRKNFAAGNFEYRGCAQAD